MKTLVRVVTTCVVWSFLLAGGAYAAPPITWDPDRLEVEIGSGIADPVEVSFRSGQAFEELTVEVVPELAPFLSVASPTVSDVEAGSEHRIELSLYIPPETPEGLYEGVLRLRRGRRTVARPLPVVVTVDYEGAAIAPGTRVLSREAAGQVVEVTPEGRVLTFEDVGGELEEIASGDVLVVPAVELVPAGFLGRVVSISEEGGHLVVVTEAAALTDAIVAADLEVDFELGEGSIVEGRALAGLAIGPKALFAPIEVPLEVVLYDLDNDLTTSTDQVRATGGVTLSPDVTLAFSIDDGEVEEFSISATASAVSELVLEAELEATFEREVEVARYRFRPIVFWVGWVPVYLQPVLAISVDVTAQVNGSLEAGARAEAAAEVAVVYQEGAWSTVQDSSLTLSPIGPTLEASASAEGRVGPELTVLLYGVVGPELQLSGFARLDAELGRCPFWWELTGGWGLDAAINMGPFSDVVSGPSYPGLISFEKLLARSEECSDGGDGEDGVDGGDGGTVPVARGPVCYIDEACSGSDFSSRRWVRNADTGECVDAYHCVELWKCPDGPTTGDCGGGGTDCTFSPGCFDDVQDCFRGLCRSSGTCNDRVKFQGFSFAPTLNECSCDGDPPAAGGCSTRVTLFVTVLGAGNVSSDPFGGVNCGSLNVNCEQTFFEGTEVVLIPTADPGAEFLRWDGDADCADGVVTMVGDVSCTAVFTDLVYILSRFPDGSGAIGVDDDLDVHLNGSAVFVDEDPLSGAVGPIGFLGMAGDQLRLRVDNNFVSGSCALTDVYLSTPAGNSNLVASESDLAPSCPIGTVMDKMVTLPE